MPGDGAVRVHDTLQGTTVELTPRDPGRISMYVCGPTVYDVPHVGHGRTAVVYDVVRRYLVWRGFDVTFVTNVTDIEDKIIARAAKTGSTEPEIAKEFEAAYWHELDRLNISRPDVMPRATEYIAPMLELVGELVDAGHAYVVDGQGVYFDVVSYSDYGELPHRTLEQLLESAGARVEVDEAKRNPVDFALWKAAKPGEPSWDSPWGPGRPGWHIECSAMSLRELGEGFDLHGAGNDLVFPHNENERAQSEAAGHSFARHWIHSGMVEIGGEKMSKSLNNFVTLADALDAHDPRAFRMAVLQTHYRKSMDLGDAELRSAASGVARLDALVRRAAAAGVEWDGAAVDDEIVGRFRDVMDDDFSTPAAVAVGIFDAAASANQAIDAGDHERAATLIATVVELAGGLGFEVGGAADRADDTDDLDAEIDQLVRERDAARAAKDFATADRLRDELTTRGVTLEDTPTGTVWHRT
jgi:cysteinyl-tRNA synthetase